MAELFLKDQSVVARHINNAFEEGELEEKSNMQILHNTRYKYSPTKVYSLDVIISVGYRVKSQRGTAFRIWARNVLKDYLLKGYAIGYYAVAAAPRTAINKNTSNAMVIIASMLPRQPHLRSPWGRGSDIRHIISPMKGVSRTDRKNAHPNPMLRRAPTSPTRAARKVSDKIPNMSNVSAIVVNFFAKI